MTQLKKPQIAQITQIFFSEQSGNFAPLREFFQQIQG